MVRWLTVAVLVLGASTYAQDELLPVQGPDLHDVMHARNFGMGGAFQTLGYGAESISGNPASLALYKRYSIELNGAWDIPNAFGLGTVALADSTTPLAMGISYNFVTFGASQRRWAHLTTVALAYAIADWLTIGLSGRHQVVVGATNTNSVTMNAGVVLRPLNWLFAGFSAHNLIYNFNDDMPRSFVASVGAMFFDSLTPCFDLQMDFNQPVARFAFKGGAEWLIAKLIPLRAGYTWDGVGNHQYVSGGVGYFNEGSGVDFSYRHEIGGSNGRLISLTLKLQL